MGATFPNESPEYRAARNKLLQHELELRREMESVSRGDFEPFRRVGRFARTTSSIIWMQRGHPRRCGCPIEKHAGPVSLGAKAMTQSLSGSKIAFGAFR